MGIAGCQVKVDNGVDAFTLFRPRLFRLDGVFAGLGEGRFGLFAGNFRVEGIAVKAQLEPFTEAAFEIGLQFAITGTEAAGTHYKGYNTAVGDGLGLGAVQDAGVLLQLGAVVVQMGAEQVKGGLGVDQVSACRYHVVDLFLDAGQGVPFKGLGDRVGLHIGVGVLFAGQNGGDSVTVEHSVLLFCAVRGCGCMVYEYGTSRRGCTGAWTAACISGHVQA